MSKETKDTITQFKLIVEEDVFSERITEYLRRGWTLWGAPRLAGPLSSESRTKMKTSALPGESGA